MRMAHPVPSLPLRFVAGCGLFATAMLPAQIRADIDLPATAPEVRLTEGLVVADVAGWGRRTINPDAIAEAMVRGTLGWPREGDVVKRPEAMGGGERTWQSARASEQGEFARLPKSAYLLCTVQSATERVVLLDASGHTMAYVNGDPHAGDMYSTGYSRIPVLLRKGANQFLFANAGRGPLKARLITPEAEVTADVGDLTLPSVLSGAPEEYVLGVPIINASNRPRSVVIGVLPEVWDGPLREERVELAPLTIQKVPLRAVLHRIKDHPDVRPTIIIREAPTDAGARGADISRATFKVHCKSPDEPHSRTFISDIDGSAQYVAISPPATEGRVEHPGLVLTLHGADVEAVRQAPCYAPKPDLVIVCPTNRRPYGFDWEDWGRIDAAEAMDHAREWFRTDPRRQYLTGHSMGGHGAWQVGVFMPERFAAVAPSAGWISFDSYAGVRAEATEPADSPIRAMLRRASASSDTLALLANLQGKGVYILHGETDDNVPVAEARLARAQLTRDGVPFEFHEQPGAGHWWDDDKPGVACVDWPGIFDMFASRRLPAPGEQTEFRVKSLESGVAPVPGDGVTIMRAERRGLEASAEVKIQRGNTGERVVVTTRNANMLALGVLVLGDATSREITIDGQETTAARRGRHVCLLRKAERWVDAGTEPSFAASMNSPWDPPRGPFKNAFTHRFVFVRATHGTAEENAWSLARARFDAEQWWYRGNGRVEIVTDDAFLRALGEGRIEGNAILYGNTDMNAAAKRLCENQAVRVSRTEAWVGTRKVSGDDVGVLAVGTFKGAAGSRVYGLVAGTGLSGARATDRIPYIIAGTGVPDVCIVRPSLWNKGVAGVECAGFLDPNLLAAKADIAWREGGEVNK